MLSETKCSRNISHAGRQILHKVQNDKVYVMLSEVETSRMQDDENLGREGQLVVDRYKHQYSC